LKIVIKNLTNISENKTEVITNEKSELTDNKTREIKAD
jgi:hypothetical protein